MSATTRKLPCDCIAEVQRNSHHNVITSFKPGPKCPVFGKLTRLPAINDVRRHFGEPVVAGFGR